MRKFGADGIHSIQINHIVNRSDIYGPGLRTVIWVQGCTLACKGCWNKELWPLKGGKSILVTELHDKLMSINDVEGITVLGGEPLQQAPALLNLLKLQSVAGRSIMLYSGYEENELDETQLSCLELADIAILGRYLEEERDTTLRWRGSRNQFLTSPTGRFDVSSIEDGEREVSVHIDNDGVMTVVGYPDMDMMLELIEDMVGRL